MAAPSAKYAVYAAPPSRARAPRRAAWPRGARAEGARARSSGRSLRRLGGRARRRRERGARALVGHLVRGGGGAGGGRADLLERRGLAAHLVDLHARLDGRASKRARDVEEVRPA